MIATDGAEARAERLVARIPVYITPDIYVYKIGDEFHVLLNEDGLPKLKINNVYKDDPGEG